VASPAATAATVALLVNIFERKAEGRSPYVRVVDVGETDTDPAKWGLNWPAQFDGYKRTATTTRTRFGGHGGNEAMPEEKIERDPWLKRMFLGYAFSIDYRDRRGHAYMLADQEATQRLTKPQSGSCLHCHASVMPLYRKLGNGDPFKGMDETSKHSYQEVSQMLHDAGLAHPVSCVDCHDPKSMALRVTRPAFLRGIQALAASQAPVPALPVGGTSWAPLIVEWRRRVPAQDELEARIPTNTNATTIFHRMALTPGRRTDDPARHRIGFSRRVIQSRDHQIRDLEPHGGLVLEVLERIEHGPEPAGADTAIEVVAERFQVDVGGVHVAVELRSRSAVHVAGSDGDRLQAALSACVGDVCRVLHKDHGIIVGKRDALAAEP